MTGLPGSPRWSLGQAEAGRIEAVLAGFLQESGAASALVIDHTGQVVVAAGAPVPCDRDGLASLAAADLSANDQLAGLLGAMALGPVVHQGEQGSVVLADVARRVILLAILDRRTTVGMVKYRIGGAVRALEAVFAGMAGAADEPSPLAGGFAGEAEAEIDRLFGA